MTEKLEVVQIEEDEFDLPTVPRVADINMKTCVIYGKEKSGKTTAVSTLPNCLIIDTEEGSNFVSGLVKQVPTDRGPVGKMQWLKKLAAKLVVDGVPIYDYVALDTLTEVNEWSEWSGTFKYMNSPQGASFNRVKDSKGIAIKKGDFLDPDDPEYQSVHTIGEGFGYRWSREEMMEIYRLFKGAAKKCVFFICHIEDKYIANKDTTELIIPKQLALTGQMRNILPRKVDAIGYVYNDKGTIKINFTGTEDKTGGNRAPHLRGYNDILDWKKIFI